VLEFLAETEEIGVPLRLCRPRRGIAGGTHAHIVSCSRAPILPGHTCFAMPRPGKGV
jgi:hypothetical protein